MAIAEFAQSRPRNSDGTFQEVYESENQKRLVRNANHVSWSKRLSKSGSGLTNQQESDKKYYEKNKERLNTQRTEAWNLNKDEENAKRRILCRDCNLGLGRFKDNPKLLFQAINYLKTWENNNGN